ncbi:hypothetical protein DFQ26_002846 [Actinomortierella ambigua]|nr:hypothetical protein DFQ26_002846 [Actinomortierella ambigua]
MTFKIMLLLAMMLAAVLALPSAIDTRSEAKAADVAPDLLKRGPDCPVIKSCPQVPAPWETLLPLTLADGNHQ